MTDDRMTLQTLLEKTSDADPLREMFGFAANRLMALEVEGLCGAGLNEGGAMEMTEGEVCPEETKSTPIAPLQAVRPSNSVLYVQESGSWFPDPGVFGHHQAQFEESSGECRLGNIS